MENVNFSNLKIQVAPNAEVFKTMDGNRKANKLNIAKIIKSVKNNGQLFSPILVNDQMEILDGQNRVQAFQEMDLEIPYIVVPTYGLKEVQVYNNFQNNWTDDNYMDSYIDLGFEEYVKYKDFKTRFLFSHGVTRSLLIGSFESPGIIGEQFRAGKFKILEMDKATKHATCVHDFNYYTKWSTKNFVQAIVEIMENVRGYNHQRMVFSLEARTTELNGRVLPVVDYKQRLQNIYNTGLSKNKKLVFYDPRELDGVSAEQLQQGVIDTQEIEFES